VGAEPQGQSGDHGKPLLKLKVFFPIFVLKRPKVEDLNEKNCLQYTVATTSPYIVFGQWGVGRPVHPYLDPPLVMPITFIHF